jgi:hypothetical protein
MMDSRHVHADRLKVGGKSSQPPTFQISRVRVLVGPSSAAWGRGPGDHGRVAYVTTDGGTTAPPDGIVRRATLLRTELQPHAAPSTPAAALVT